jgi:hypothetical protein
LISPLLLTFSSLLPLLSLLPPPILPSLTPISICLPLLSSISPSSLLLSLSSLLLAYLTSLISLIPLPAFSSILHLSSFIPLPVWPLGLASEALLLTANNYKYNCISSMLFCN